jgi:hypothetical protein
MTKEFIPYEQSLELKNLGFDEPCLIKDTEQGEEFSLYYVHENGIPTFSQVFRWFRENHNITSSVRTHFNEEFFYEIYVDVMNEITSNYYKTYEESELECIKKLIEIVKNK